MTSLTANSPEQGGGSPEAVREALSAYDTARVHALVARLPPPDLGHIPGGRGLPMFGHGPALLFDVHRWVDRRYRRYGPVFRMNMPVLNQHGSGGVVMLGPQANQIVFQNEGQRFSNYLAWNASFRGLFDDNLLQRDFGDHKSLRKILQSAFRREAIEGHMELLNPALEAGVKRWPTRRAIRSMDFVKELFLSAGSLVFLGEEPGADTRKVNRAFTDLVTGSADLLRNEKLWFSPYARGVRARRYLSERIVASIPERRRLATRDLLSNYCCLKNEQGEYFRDEEIRDQLLFVLFAAHDTTTSTISSVLYSIASNPEWQEAVREEMLALDKGGVEFEDLDRMGNTSLVIKEALRMFPPLVMMPRHALEDFEYEGYRIPAGANVVVSALFTHYMPEYWTDPHRFDPQRFAPGRAEDKQHLFQYIPFGGGAHKCLGLHFAQVQSKIFLFHLLKNFEVTKSPRMRRYKYTHVPLTFPTDGLPLTFTPIH